MAQAGGELGDAKVVVTVFEGARDGTCHGAEALVVEVLYWHITQIVPGVEAATTFTTPIFGAVSVVIPSARVPTTGCKTYHKALPQHL